MKKILNKTINIISVILVSVVICSMPLTNTSSALTYSDEVNVQFTFNPSVSISLSSPALVIEDLSPGNSSDSNTITVTTNTNSSAGFVLTASVGDGTHLGPSYNNTNLNHSNNTNVFTSIATNSDLTSLTTDNTWGYSLSSNSGSTWSNYSGLPIYSSTPKTLLETSAQGSSDIQFKIAAKASLGQASGDYTNVINFVAVATPEPEFTPPVSCTTPVSNLTYMQDLNQSNKASILANMTEDAQYYLVDKRDNKAYCVAKLKDGNLWMTQNLDHDIVIDSSVTYDNTTTDIGWNGSSYSTASWTPSASTKTSGDTTWDDDLNTGSYIPQSYDPGSLYWSGTLNDSTPVSSGNSHYHLGNYYSWTAAVAMNDSSGYTIADANQSICPANWTLPKGGSISSSGSFEYLFVQYGWSTQNQYISTIWNTPIHIPLSGNWNGSLGDIGRWSYYWTSIARNEYGAHDATTAYDGRVWINLSNYARSDGRSVRCLVR